jgi:hypothetical protein
MGDGVADVDLFWIWEQHASGMMQVRRIHTGISITDALESHVERDASDKPYRYRETTT